MRKLPLLVGVFAFAGCVNQPNGAAPTLSPSVAAPAAQTANIAGTITMTVDLLMPLLQKQFPNVQRSTMIDVACGSSIVQTAAQTIATQPAGSSIALAAQTTALDALTAALQSGQTAGGACNGAKL